MSKFHEAMHGRRRTFNREVYGQFTGETRHELYRFTVIGIHYDGNPIGPTTHHDTRQTFNHGNTVYRHQRFRLSVPFRYQTVSLACRYDAETHNPFGEDSTPCPNLNA